MLFAGLRRQHTFAEAGRGIARQWQEFVAQPVLPGRVGDRRYGVMCGSSAAGIEYMCGVEVSSFTDVPADVGRVRVPEQRYAVFAHHGPPASIAATWEGILAWFDRTTLQSAHKPDFEVYVPGSDMIEVYVGVV